MADFLTSTHRDHWMFCKSDLVQKAREANERAVKALQQYGATRVEILQDGTLAYPGVPENERTGKRPEPLTLDEELLILRFYEEKIQQVCRAFSFPNKIQATAVLYFKRFYLSWSVMEHDPKHIMLTCVYISCKVEEFHVSAEELGKGIQQDHSIILRNELFVLQVLNFDLIVYAPYRALDGFIIDMQRWIEGKPEVTASKLSAIQNAAFGVVHRIILTDCPLLFAPGQIALAALRSANIQEKCLDMDRYLRSICDRQPHKRSFSELVAILNEIIAIVESTQAPVQAEVKRIDRKLKFCRNPGLQHEARKRDRKGKHKPKRGAQDTAAPTA